MTKNIELVAKKTSWKLQVEDGGDLLADATCVRWQGQHFVVTETRSKLYVLCEGDDHSPTVELQELGPIIEAVLLDATS